MEEKKNDLCERLFEFAVRVIKFLRTLPFTPENKTIRVQLSKAACSSGANYEESQAESSKPNFNNGPGAFQEMTAILVSRFPSFLPF